MKRNWVLLKYLHLCHRTRRLVGCELQSYHFAPSMQATCSKKIPDFNLADFISQTNAFRLLKNLETDEYFSGLNEG